MIVLLAVVAAMTAVFHHLTLAEGGNTGGNTIYLPLVSRSTTCTVPSADFPTIQSAVDAKCDFINLTAALYVENNIFIPDHSVSITGQGPGATTINGNFVDRVFWVEADSSLRLEGMTVTNGRPVYGPGGGILNLGTVHLLNTVVSNNDSDDDPGGGIYTYNGTLTAENSSIINNDTYFSSTGAKGGGVYIRGTAHFTNTVISGNIANAGGGVAVAGFANDTTITFFNSQIAANEAWEGGGIRLYKNSAVIINNSMINNNNGWDTGGGIANGGNMQILNSQVNGNTAGDDKGIGSCGGGILNSGGSQNTDDVGILLINNSEIMDNRSDYKGAGICNDREPDNDPIAKLEIYNSLIAGNENISPYGTFGSGGGIYSDSSVVAKIENTTFYENEGGAYGGAISAIVANLVNVTLFKNGAVEGGGIYSMGQIEFINSIIAGSVSGANCDSDTLGNVNSQGYNIASDNSCNLVAAGDMPNTTPLLGPLQDNGGPTWTLALLANSPARDNGDNSACPPTDQRGVLRPQGPACDIGAYEYDD
jgi:hypothetical protein